MAHISRLSAGLATLLVLASLIGACGGGDGDDGGSDKPSAGAQGGQVSFARAASIARREVGGGQVDGVDRDDVGTRPAWQVTIDRGDVEHKVSIAIAGGRVLKHERQRGGGGARADTEAPSTEAGGGVGGLARAVSIARREVGGGELDGVERDDVGTRPAWQVTIDRGDVEHKVSVAIEGGRVLKHDRQRRGA